VVRLEEEESTTSEVISSLREQHPDPQFDQKNIKILRDAQILEGNAVIQACDVSKPHDCDSLTIVVSDIVYPEKIVITVLDDEGGSTYPMQRVHEMAMADGVGASYEFQEGTLRWGVRVGFVTNPGTPATETEFQFDGHTLQVTSCEWFGRTPNIELSDIGGVKVVEEERE